MLSNKVSKFMNENSQLETALLLPAIPLEAALIEQYSKLTHVTSVKSAEHILAHRCIFGTDYLGHANFGLQSAIRADLAKECEVVLFFSWEGIHAELDHMFFGEYESWDYPPKENVAYHIMTDSAIPKRYWQTNIYGCSSGLKFLEARPFTDALPKYPFLFSILSMNLYYMVDKQFACHKQIHNQIEALNRFSGVNIEVPYRINT